MLWSIRFSGRSSAEHALQIFVVLAGAASDKHRSIGIQDAQLSYAIRMPDKL
jgi:hypothetical protein